MRGDSDRKRWQRERIKKRKERAETGIEEEQRGIDGRGEEGDRVETAKGNSMCPTLRRIWKDPVAAALDDG